MFTSIYNFFKTKRLLLTLTVLLLSGAAVFTALKIRTSEDLAKMIPVDAELKRFNFANKHIKINDKIIINLSLKNGNSETNPEKLQVFADSLEKILLKNNSDQIAEIKNTVGEQTLKELYDIFYKNLPVFLTEEDYLKIDTLLQNSEIKKTLAADFRTLISPASMVTKKFITKDPLSITPLALKRLNKLQLDNNYEIYDNHIFTKDKKHLLLFVTSKYPNDETGKNKLLIDGINKTLNNLQAIMPEVNAEIFGAPVISVGNAERIKKDILLTVSIAIILLFLFLSLFYKRFDIFFVIFLPAAFGAAVSLSLLYFIKGEVSAVSLGIGSVLVGISIDYSLHIFTHFRSKKDVSEIFKDISVPVLMSALTSSAAFFCLLFVSSDALRDLGLYAGISVIAAALFALTVLPHFLKPGSKSEKEKKQNLIEKFTAYAFHKNKYAISLLLIVTIVSFFTFHKAEFESDMDKMNYMSPELKAAEKHLSEISNDALRKMYFVANGKTLDDALQTNDILFSKIRELQKNNIVKTCSSVGYFIVSDSLQKLRIKRWEKFIKKRNPDSIKQKLIKFGKIYGFKETAFSEFYNLLKKDFKPLSSEDKENLTALLGNDLITQDTNSVNIVTLLKLKQEDKAAVYKNIPATSKLYIVDKKYITDKIVTILKKDFNKLVKISLITVFIILLLYFGRIELTLITFIPMLISWLWTLGIMWIFGLKFTIFNIIISTFIFGLGIDYGIFITRGLLQRYRCGTDNLPSYKTSVLLSAITTVTAIGVLIFAKHPAMRSIAFLSVTGILSVVFVTYTLQPIMFDFLIRQQGKMRSAPVTAKDLFFGLLVFLIFVIGSVITILLWSILALIPFGKQNKKKIFHYWLHLTFKMIAYIPLNVKKIINNPFGENFKNPAVIIANHQSHIDIPLIMMLHPKILILTNDWVQNNIFYGRIVKFADYYPTSNGFDKNLKLLKEKVKQGYSILIYPEGSRSPDLEIKRFHKGAFEYAKELNIDILPIIIQGAGDCIPKGEPFLKSGQISVNILKRINIDDFGNTSREQAKNIRKLMQKEYAEIRKKYETPAYFRKKLIANYIYKGPVLEHYTRIKTKLENNYEFFNNILPEKGHITDIGTGYGYLPYMLSFCSKERTLTGIDYDCNKINTAAHNISKSDKLNFICADVLEADFPKSDAFVINDVLHYMPKDKQKELIIKCIKNLNPEGKIIIRDGNAEMKKKHKGTKLTEFFSTRLLKFNKTKYDKLHFTSKSEILKIVSAYNFEVNIIDETKFTSNIMFVLKRF